MDALVAAAAWACGINPYLAVLGLGVLARLDAAPVPDAFGALPLMVGSGVLALLHFVVDKIPLVDSLSDVVHTAIRPTVAALVGYAVADQAEVLGLLGGGAIGLLAHVGKASLRAVVNHSPEPGSNIVVSVAEDTAVAGVLWLASERPAVAGGVVAVLLVAAIVVAVVAVRSVRAVGRRVRERVHRWRDRGSTPAADA